MNREELLGRLCPNKNIDICRSEMGNASCEECNNVMNTYLDEYDKHVIAEYEAKHGNLADMIRDIHDCVAKEMYRKGIDDFLNAIAEHFNKNLDDYIEHGATYSDIKQIAKQLKEQE